LKCLSVVTSLLTSHPENESVLLSLLVNKLGDPSSSVSSKAGFGITKVLAMHGNMVFVVIDEIERLLWRNNVSVKGLGTGLTVLNTIKIENEKVGKRLVEVYFKVFKKIVGELKSETVPVENDKLKKKKKPRYSRNKSVKKEGKVMKKLEFSQINSKIMSAILTGINRSFPFSKFDKGVFEGHLDTLYEILHISNFNTCIQSLNLIYQVTLKKEGECNKSKKDRYFRAVYNLLLDPRLLECKQSKILNLIYKSLKNDESLPRILHICKRLIQVKLNLYCRF
jgi:ribosome biogenesis protein MAK21